MLYVAERCFESGGRVWDHVRSRPVIGYRLVMCACWQSLAHSEPAYVQPHVLHGEPAYSQVFLLRPSCRECVSRQTGCDELLHPDSRPGRHQTLSPESSSAQWSSACV